MQALKRLQDLAAPLLLSPLNELELCNALRLAAFRGLMPADDVHVRIDAFHEDREAGRWRRSGVPLEEIVLAAERLSAAHTPRGGHRTFDIMHVAHAQIARAKTFLSFDATQLQLSKAAGLKT